eukprot:TRINITY_DN4056_c0_g1_i3.p1 TRINITY_DN4056_c0_g1~~TRINITY_DN4056_c0_g1_i3.p1  ORF type:complete len:367 (+),score=64.17 TRINITY_DN4056_c0_g1_i3:272-1372(+)
MATTTMAARVVSSHETKSLLLSALTLHRGGISVGASRVQAQAAQPRVTGAGSVLAATQTRPWVGSCRFCSGGSSAAGTSVNAHPGVSGRAAEAKWSTEPSQFGMRRTVMARSAMGGSGRGERAETPDDGVAAGSMNIGASSTATSTSTVTTSSGATESAAVASEAETSRPAVRKVVRRRVAAPVQEVLPTRGVEEKGITVEGVAKVDRDDEEGKWQRIALLCAGDVASLLLFAFIGKVSHGSAVASFDFVQVAAPFVAGWLLSAPVLGGYGAEARGLKGTFPATGAAAKCWAVGVPLGIVIRGLSNGHMPPKAFVIVTLGTTFVLLVGWRSAFAVWSGKSGKKSGGNRRGNPLEFLQLLTSLVRRW